MYLQLYAALKQPFKDHLHVVLECFHHLFFFFFFCWLLLRSRALDLLPVASSASSAQCACSHLIVVILLSYFFCIFPFFSSSSFLFAVCIKLQIWLYTICISPHSLDSCTLLLPPLQQVRQSVGFCCNCLIKKIEKNVVGAYAAPARAALQLRSSLVRILLSCLRSLCLYLRQPLPLPLSLLPLF